MNLIKPFIQLTMKNESKDQLTFLDGLIAYAELISLRHIYIII